VFGSPRDHDEAVAVIRRARERGVDHIDTAAFYFSPGGILAGEPGAVRYATDLIRKALRPYPEGLMIVTKVGPDRRADGEWGQAETAAQLRSQVEDNLRRLGVVHESYGLSGQRGHVFLATGLTAGPTNLSLEEGDLVCQHIPFEEFPKLVAAGRITDACSLAAYALLMLDAEWSAEHPRPHAQTGSA
jgi:hypothetical protein